MTLEQLKRELEDQYGIDDKGLMEISMDELSDIVDKISEETYKEIKLKRYNKKCKIKEAIFTKNEISYIEAERNLCVEEVDNNYKKFRKEQ